MEASGSETLEEEYNLVLRAMQNFIAQNEHANQPVLLQIRRGGTEGQDQMTLFLSHVLSDSRANARDEFEPTGSADPTDFLGSSFLLPAFMTNLGPLIFQALSLHTLFLERRRRIAAPLDEESVGHLQRMVLTSENIAQLELEERNVCSICQDSFVSGSEVYCLPCGHMFDVQCLRQWFSQTRTCPNCRFLLRDIEQQYKNAVTPLWWSGVCDNNNNNNNDSEGGNLQEESSRGQDPVAGNADFYSRDTPILPGNVEIIRSYEGSVHGQEEEEGQQRQHEEFEDELLSPQTHLPSLPSFASGAGSMSRETPPQDNSDHSFFSVPDAQASSMRKLEPMPPVDAPRRVCEAFRERIFSDEPMTTPPLLLLSTTTTTSHTAESRDARGGNGQNLQRLHGSFFGREEGCSYPPAHSRELLSPSLAVTAAGNVSLHDLSETDVLPIFSSQQEYSCNRGSGDHRPPSLAPRVIPRPPPGERTSCCVLATRGPCENHQQSQQIAVSGNAMRAVQALRRCRDDEPQALRSSSQISDGNVSEEISVSNPRRFRLRTFNRAAMYSTLQDPRTPLQVSEEVSHQRGGNGGRRNEAQSLGESVSQSTGCKNEKNMTQHESNHGNRGR